MFGFGKKEPYILHIDDELDLRALVEELLPLLGYRCLSVASVSEGLAAAKKDPPALILLDTMMPGVDGRTACRLVRAEPALKRIPIVMVTSLQRMSDVEASFEAGANDYVVKPIDVDRLREKLAKHLPPVPPS